MSKKDAAPAADQGAAEPQDSAVARKAPKEAIVDKMADFSKVNETNPMGFSTYPGGCADKPWQGGMNELIALPKALHCPDREKLAPEGDGPLCNFEGWVPEDHAYEEPPLRCPGER